ncbi:MAG TPA: MFS transporter [Acidimicrobiales bacterium]|nr:MFS transporter [Acidimicrobiales bacterium]
MRATEDDTARRSGTFRAALRQRSYRLVLAAYGIGVASIGANGVVVAISLYERTGSSAWAGISAVSGVLPFLLLSPIAGVIVDRTDPRRMLCIAVAGQVGVGLALVPTAEHGALPLVAGLGFVGALFWTLAYPSTAALVPRTVPTEDLAPANALLTTADTVAWSIGPGLAGLLLGARGYVPAAVASATVAGVAVACGLAALRRPLTELVIDHDQPERFLQALRTGVRTIRSSSNIVVPLALVLVAYFVYGAAEVLLLVAATDLLDMGRGGYGALTAALGVGSFAAVAVANRAAAAQRTTALLGAGVLAGGLPLALLAAVETPAVALVLVACAGLGSVIADVLILATMQRIVPADQLARVFGILEALLVAAVILGSTISALIVSVAGIRAALVVVGSVVPITAVATLPRLLRRAPPELADLTALQPAIELLGALPMLRAASRTSIEALARTSSRDTVAAGVTAVAQGDHPDDFFAIVRGRFEVWKTDAAGVTSMVNALGPGDGFGEIGLLQGVPRTASVLATSEAEVLRIPGAAFLHAVGPGAVRGGVGPAASAVDYFTAG